MPVKPKLSASWFVYIARCANNAFYTGITNDIERRMKAHNTGKGALYTKFFGPVQLLWKEAHENRSTATKREIQIKRYSRRKKEALALAGDEGKPVKN